MGGPLKAGADPRSAKPMNDAKGLAGLLNARGAEGWELVAVVPQADVSSRDGMSYVAYMKSLTPMGDTA